MKLSEFSFLELTHTTGWEGFDCMALITKVVEMKPGKLRIGEWMNRRCSEPQYFACKCDLEECGKPVASESTSNFHFPNS